MRERERERQTDRQTGRQTVREKGRKEENVRVRACFEELTMVIMLDNVTILTVLNVLDLEDILRSNLRANMVYVLSKSCRN